MVNLSIALPEDEPLHIAPYHFDTLRLSGTVKDCSIKDISGMLLLNRFEPPLPHSQVAVYSLDFPIKFTDKVSGYSGHQLLVLYPAEAAALGLTAAWPAVVKALHNVVAVRQTTIISTPILLHPATYDFIAIYEILSLAS